MPDSSFTDRPVVRRAISLPALFGSTALSTLALPVTYGLAALADRASGGRRHHRRILLFVTRALHAESAGVMATGALWLRSGLGTQPLRPPDQDRLRRLQLWWVRRLAQLGERHLDLRLDSSGEVAGDGPVIVLSRHSCIADALAPAIVFADERDHSLFYVLKHDLQWGPCLDIVGNRLPNVFVDRSVRSSAQRGAIADMAGAMDDQGALVVFPEGTFPTPDRVERARRRLTDEDPERAERMSALRHLLPPHPGGVLAALAGAPTADVVLMAHVGFEDAATLRQFYDRVPFVEPIKIQLDRIPRHTIPTEPADQVAWLDEQWLAMDRWVDSLTSPHRRGVTP